MKSHYLRHFAVLILAGLSWNHDLVAKEVVILYINTGDQVVDDASHAAMELMVDELNEGGTTAGFHYTWRALHTFESAYQYFETKPSGLKIITVCHGVFRDGQYSGNLRDTTTESTPETVVRQRLLDLIHCNKDGYLDQTDIGRMIAYLHNHNYGLAGVSVGTGSTGSHLDDRLVHVYRFVSDYYLWQRESGSYMPRTIYYY